MYVTFYCYASQSSPTQVVVRVDDVERLALDLGPRYASLNVVLVGGGGAVGGAHVGALRDLAGCFMVVVVLVCSSNVIRICSFWDPFNSFRTALALLGTN